MKSISKVYSDICTEKCSDYYCIESFQPRFKKRSSFTFLKQIGKGKFSHVYLGYKNRKPQEQIAIKWLEQRQEFKIKREMKILHLLKNGQQIIHRKQYIYDAIDNRYGITFEYCIPYNYQDLFVKFTEHDVKMYMKQLFQGLDFIHSHGVMHRDIKPSNLSYDPNSKVLKILDFGLAEFYHPYTSYPLKNGTLPFKSPEILFGMSYYDYSIDIWAAGTILATLLYKIFPFFKGKDDDDIINSIENIIGSTDINDYIQKYQLSERQLHNIVKQQLVHDNHDALKLLLECWRIDHEDRITALEAIHHYYFIRDM